MSLGLAIVGLVALQRLAELGWSARNTRRLLAAGAIEAGRGHYPIMVAFHGLWLAATAFVARDAETVSGPALALYVVLQAARLWVLASLGGRWTTRIIVARGGASVRAGPYRWARHPNYLIVAAELATLPMVFGAWPLAIAASALHLPLLVHRIRVEDAALDTT